MRRRELGGQSRTGWLTVGASTVGRILLGFEYASFVVIALPDAEASRMFQLLFLQGGLVALLSASAYARGAQLASRGNSFGPALSSFIRFLLAGTVLAFLAAVALVPHEEGWTTPVRASVLALLVLGAAGTALNGLLQGLTVVTKGALIAFMPSIVVSFLACGAILAMWNSRAIVPVVAVWVIPQIIMPFVLVAINTQLRGLIGGIDLTVRDSENYFVGTGTINASSVGVAYAFRERWASEQSAQHTATGFYVVRLTELAYQIAYMVLASMPGAVGRLSSSRVASHGASWLLLVPVMILAALGSLPAFLWPDWSLSHFLAAEALVAPVRICAMICMLALLGRATTLPYQLAVGLGIAVASVLMLIPFLQESPYGLQAFQAATSVAILIVAFVVFQRDQTRSS